MTRLAIRSVLAATDLGPSSDRVVRAAAVLAAKLNADLHLLHVPDLSVAPNRKRSVPTPGFQARLEEAEAALAEQVRTLAPEVPPASLRVMNFVPHKAILARATEVGADLVVMGPHRRGDVSARVLGTTAEEVLRAADVPCLVVPAQLQEPIRRIGVATDFSDSSRRALDFAVSLAAPLGTAGGGDAPEIRVFHVGWEVDQVDDPGLGERELLPRVEREVGDAMARSGPAAAPRTRSDVIWGISPTEAIAAYAEKERLDLLVMGTHGQTGLKRLLMGSVASGVARHGPCPVLLVPPRRAA